MQKESSKYRFSVGIGAGYVLMTSDEKMLMSGNFFYPCFIHRMKEHRVKAIEKALDNLKSLQRYTLVSFTWENKVILPVALEADGWKTNLSNVERENNFVLQYHNDEKRVTVHSESVLKNDAGIDEKEQIKDYIDKFSAKKDPCFIFELNDFLMYKLDLLAKDGAVKKVSEGLYLLTPPASSRLKNQEF